MQVFDEDTNMVQEHLPLYFIHLVNDKVLGKKCINNGLSRLSNFLCDLALDMPQIHKYLMDFLI